MKHNPVYHDSSIHQDTPEHLPATLLITGATGFIGRSLLAALQASGIWSKRKGCCYFLMRRDYLDNVTLASRRAGVGSVFNSLLFKLAFS